MLHDVQCFIEENPVPAVVLRLRLR